MKCYMQLSSSRYMQLSSGSEASAGYQQLVSLRGFAPRLSIAACQLRSSVPRRWRTAPRLISTAAIPQVVDEGGRVITEEDLFLHRVQGYRSMHLEGCEYFIAEDGQGRLDLRDTYVVDWSTQEPRRPHISGELPITARRYMEAVWLATFDGDMVNYKEPETRVDRIYLIAEKDDGSQLLDFNQIYRLDWTTQDVRQEAVTWRTTVSDPMQHVMRIRENDVLIEDLDTVPTVEEVVQEFEDSKLDETLNELRGMQQEVLESTSLADPIESRKDAEVDENSPDDTPASDMI